MKATTGEYVCRLLMLVTAAACMAKDTGIGFAAGVVTSLITWDWAAAWARLQQGADALRGRLRTRAKARQTTAATT
jgi:hypothetical protein